MASFILIIAFWGIAKKRSYTNLTENEDYLEELQVAELPERIAADCCSELRKTLPKASVIARVLVTGKLENTFGISRQRVSIMEVYKGENVKEGEEIYLYSQHWQLDLGGDIKSIERGFVNIMDMDTEYLTFIEKRVNDINMEIPVYQLCDNMYISSVFCYENRDNVIFPTKMENTYVPYAKVKNNEFFVQSEKALHEMEELKRELLSAYPKK